VAAQQEPLAAIWALRTTDCESGVIEARLRETMATIARELLDGLYPGALAGLPQGAGLPEAATPTGGFASHG
jgi:hypothetical protein